MERIIWFCVKLCPLKSCPEALHSESDDQRGQELATVSRPYSFIEFDIFVQKTKKLYTDACTQRNLGSLNPELQNVQSHGSWYWRSVASGRRTRSTGLKG